MRYLMNVLRCSGMASALILCGCLGDNRYASPNPVDGQAPPEPPLAGVPFIAVTDEYSHEGVNAQNAKYTDSDRFRIYSNSGYSPGDLVDAYYKDEERALEYLESAYTYFVDEWGFRSPALSVYSNAGPYYKMNVYVTDLSVPSENTVGAFVAGQMLSDVGAGLSFVRTLRDHELINIISPQVLIHEFGHTLTFSEYNWSSQSNTRAWKETVAEWVADAYLNSPVYNALIRKNGWDREIVFNSPRKALRRAHLTIVHKKNKYAAWPFLAYLTKNPDGIAGLGKMIVPNLHRQHQHNNETPLHVLERIIAPVTVQYVLGRYWARMAYFDINHDSFHYPLNTPLPPINDTQIAENYSHNWQSLGGGEYQVLPTRQPMYGGANITRLNILRDNVLGDDVKVQVLTADNTIKGFTATLSIYNATTEQRRYIQLIEGYAKATLSADESAT